MIGFVLIEIFIKITNGNIRKIDVALLVLHLPIHDVFLVAGVLVNSQGVSHFVQDDGAHLVLAPVFHAQINGNVADFSLLQFALDHVP